MFKSLLMYLLFFGMPMVGLTADLVLPPYAGSTATKTNKKESGSNNIIVQTLAIPSLAISPLKVKSIEIKEQVLGIPELKINEIQKNVSNIKSVMSRVSGVFLDKRTIFSVGNLSNFQNGVLDQWLDIYNMEFPGISYVAPPSGVRMIAEVRVPRSEEESKILYDNLNNRKAQGYNAVLVTFDGSESVDDLVALVMYIKEFGFNVWFAFGGADNLQQPVFISPEKYATCLSSLSPLCNGFISGWRRTSAHLFIQDDKFMEYTAYNLRMGNPAIPIIGEIYLGETANVDLVDWITYQYTNSSNIKVNLVRRLVAGGSGYLLVNFGNSRADAAVVMKQLLADVTLPKYILVNGPGAYYLSSNKKTYTVEETERLINNIEKRWLRAGCIGTIVLHGDGSESVSVSDNMSVYRPGVTTK